MFFFNQFRMFFKREGKMKDILKIVITGGPCAGKTTALEMLEVALQEDDDTVIIINETATELMQGGIRPFGRKKDALALINFQRMILRTQLAKEDKRLESIPYVPNDSISVLYDRGAMDNGAYLEDEEFEGLIAEEGVTEEELLNRYDLVIHLMSTAVDKASCYVNSKERKEDPKEARRLDRKTVRMWSKHKNLIVIDNEGTIEEKVDLVIKVIRAFKEYRVLSKEENLGSFQEWVRERIKNNDSPKVYKKAM